MHFDELLTDYLGEFGRYQIIVFLMTGSVGILASFMSMSIPFLVAVPEHWCDVPDLNDIARPLNLTDEQYRHLTAPPGESCQMYHANYSTWGVEDVNNYLLIGPPPAPVVDCRDGMSYSDAVYKSSIVTEWDLVCDNSVMRATAMSASTWGHLIGVFIAASLSDRFGRKIVWSVSLVMTVISGGAVSFSPNYVMFCVFRFIVGIFAGEAFGTGFVYCLEITGVSWRIHIGVLYQYTWAVGYLILAAYAYFLQLDWRYLNLLLSTSCAVIFIFIPFLPESPRWCYAAMKDDEGDRLVKNVAKWNKKSLPDPLSISVKAKDKAYIWNLITTPRIRFRTIVTFYLWFTSSLMYYGLSFGSTNLGGNQYLNFAISGAVEIPAYAFCQLSLVYLGRRSTLAGTFLAAGVVQMGMIGTMYLDESWPTVTLSMIGKFCITAAFALVYIVSGEVFPTVIRHLGLAAGGFAAGMGGVVAPYTMLLNMYGDWVPATFYGVCSVIAAIVTLTLPEMGGQKLPDTIEDIEGKTSQCVD